MTPYHHALAKCARRYLDMQGGSPEGDLYEFTRQFADGCASGMPVPKLCRWLGYIQGVLIERGLTTVREERDWTRPHLRPLDYPLTRAQKKWLKALQEEGFVEAGYQMGRSQKNRPLRKLVELGYAEFGFGPRGAFLQSQGFMLATSPKT